MADPLNSRNILERLHKMGLHLSIDDFGIGYSSHGYLQGLPFDEIKVDKSFVINMRSDKGRSLIVRPIIELGHSLGHKITAEGVEDQETLDKLTSLKCDFAQGFFIGRPVTSTEITGLLNKAVTS